MPGCESECKASKTVRRKSAGMKGRGTPVDMSHTIGGIGGRNGDRLKDER